MIEAGGEYTSNNGEASSAEESSSSEVVDFEVNGGDITLVNNVPAWMATNKDPNNWIAIEREGVNPLLGLLSDQYPYLSQKVEKVWQAHRKKLWGTTPPRDVPLPLMENKRFQIRRTDGSTLSHALTGVANIISDGNSSRAPQLQVSLSQAGLCAGRCRT